MTTDKHSTYRKGADAVFNELHYVTQNKEPSLAAWSLVTQSYSGVLSSYSTQLGSFIVNLKSAN